MKIYTEVVWEWDSTKNELVEVSSESFDYEGPLVQAWAQLALAGLSIATSVYGAVQKKKLGEAQAHEMGLTNAENEIAGQLKRQHAIKEFRRNVREVRRRGAYAKAGTRLKGEKLSKRNFVKRAGRGAKITRGTPLNLAVQDIMNTEYMASMQENETFMNLDNMNHSHHDWLDLQEYNMEATKRRGEARRALAKRGADLSVFGDLTSGLIKSGSFAAKHDWGTGGGGGNGLDDWKDEPDPNPKWGGR